MLRHCNWPHYICTAEQPVVFDFGIFQDPQPSHKGGQCLKTRVHMLYLSRVLIKKSVKFRFLGSKRYFPQLTKAKNKVVNPFWSTKCVKKMARTGQIFEQSVNTIFRLSRISLPEVIPLYVDSWLLVKVCWLYISKQPSELIMLW